MHIIQIASEVAPLAKVGGLGDVILGLSRELVIQGHDVDLILPKYDTIDTRHIRDLTVFYPGLKSYYAGSWYENTIWVGWVENFKVYFIESHHPRHFFDRGCVYGCEDDIERFLYFCRTAMEFLYKADLKADVIHLHDWHTAVVSALYKEIYRPLGYQCSALVFTIHNMEYQGKCAKNDLVQIGLKPEAEAYFDKQNPQLVNLIKTGLYFCDGITTVSPSYSEELRTIEGGKGLDRCMVDCKNKVIGILNGLDYVYWNPETDPLLPSPYSFREQPLNKNDYSTINQKAYVKKVLRETLMLDEGHRPLIGIVTRLVPQKGLELIKHAISRTVEKKGQLVLLGSSPIPSIHREFEELQHQFSAHPHIRLILNHDEMMAHLIFGGSDFCLVPSLFEPCGLVQMIALRYGSVPIVRLTGGLADTVFDVDDPDFAEHETNGYTFVEPTAEGVNSALDRAIKCWFEKPEKWRQLQLRGMQMDYSWKYPAMYYIHLYQNLSKI